MNQILPVPDVELCPNKMEEGKGWEGESNYPFA